MPTSDESLYADYQQRINRVFQYIDEHLDADLSLERLADIAAFSPFHFHRIFKFITGEQPHAYVSRRKIEKAALDLLHQQIPASVIAHRYGFSDTSSFSRAFKKYYSVSPTEFIKQHPHRVSKIRQLQRKIGQAYPDREKYLCLILELTNWITMNAKIELKEVPSMELAYVSCIGSEHLGNAFQTLTRWATPKGLMHEQAQLLTVYHDSFKVTEASKVRMSAGMVIHEEIPAAGEIAMRSLAPGKCIVGSFEIRVEEFEKSWTGLFLWMNEQGYKKADQDPFELYHNNFNEHPEKKARVDFYIPIV